MIFLFTVFAFIHFFNPLILSRVWGAGMGVCLYPNCTRHVEKQRQMYSPQVQFFELWEETRAHWTSFAPHVPPTAFFVFEWEARSEVCLINWIRVRYQPVCPVSFLGPVEHVQLLAPFVVIRNKEVNITAVVLPSHSRTVTYFWWLGNNTEVTSAKKDSLKTFSLKFLWLAIYILVVIFLSCIVSAAVSRLLNINALICAWEVFLMFKKNKATKERSRAKSSKVIEHVLCAWSTLRLTLAERSSRVLIT